MTVQRVVELLKIELECIKRNNGSSCDRHCESCDLLQDSQELIDCYETALFLLQGGKEQMPEYRRVMEHIEVYENGEFICSADNLREAEEEYEQYKAENHD